MMKMVNLSKIFGGYRRNKMYRVNDYKQGDIWSEEYKTLKEAKDAANEMWYRLSSEDKMKHTIEIESEKVSWIEYQYMQYVIRDRETGNIITWADSLEEAEYDVEDFEECDRIDGTYTENFYEVVRR